jgi:hypothetical protein
MVTLVFLKILCKLIVYKLTTLPQDIDKYGMICNIVRTFDSLLMMQPPRRVIGTKAGDRIGYRHSRVL